METVYTSEQNQPFTFSDILGICKGNTVYANKLIERLTWQHPETLITEDLELGELFSIGGNYYLLEQIGSIKITNNVEGIDLFKGYLDESFLSFCLLISSENGDDLSSIDIRSGLSYLIEYCGNIDVFVNIS